ncbi:MAG: Xylulose kinase [Microbacteriaceae bacterium]|jgi:AraC-like DNA-binding protein|nr:Xylulose kinase [Microbacteriaceae bacterium]
MFRSHPVASSGDIDHARQVLSDIFLPLDFASASPSTALDLSLNVIKVGRVTAGYLRFGDAVRIRTSEATDYHVDIPLTGRATMRAGMHKPVYGTPRTAAVFVPGHPAVLDCDKDFAQVSVMVPRAELQLELENLLGRSVVKPLVFSAELDLTTGPGCTVLQILHLIDLASKNEGGLLQHPLAAQRLEQVLMESLLLAQPHNHSAALSSTTAASAGTRPVAQAVELLRDSPEHGWTVSELAGDVGVSVRSLQEGFRRSMSTTPMTYLRQLRLEQIHKELSDAEPGSVTVTEVAAKWGISHFGRFAASYRHRFSEQPSDTMGRTSVSSD